MKKEQLWTNISIEDLKPKSVKFNCFRHQIQGVCVDISSSCDIYGGDSVFANDLIDGISFAIYSRYLSKTKGAKYATPTKNYNVSVTFDVTGKGMIEITNTAEKHSEQIYFNQTITFITSDGKHYKRSGITATEIIRNIFGDNPNELFRYFYVGVKTNGELVFSPAETRLFALDYAIGNDYIKKTLGRLINIELLTKKNVDITQKDLEECYRKIEKEINLNLPVYITKLIDIRSITVTDCMKVMRELDASEKRMKKLHNLTKQFANNELLGIQEFKFWTVENKITVKERFVQGATELLNVLHDILNHSHYADPEVEYNIMTNLFTSTFKYLSDLSSIITSFDSSQLNEQTINFGTTISEKYHILSEYENSGVIRSEAEHAVYFLKNRTDGRIKVDMSDISLPNLQNGSTVEQIQKAFDVNRYVSEILDLPQRALTDTEYDALANRVSTINGVIQYLKDASAKRKETLHKLNDYYKDFLEEIQKAYQNCEDYLNSVEEDLEQNSFRNIDFSTTKETLKNLFVQLKEVSEELTKSYDSGHVTKDAFKPSVRKARLALDNLVQQIYSVANDIYEQFTSRWSVLTKLLPRLCVIYAVLKDKENKARLAQSKYAESYFKLKKFQGFNWFFNNIKKGTGIDIKVEIRRKEMEGVLERASEVFNYINCSKGFRLTMGRPSLARRYSSDSMPIFLYDEKDPASYANIKDISDEYKWMVALSYIVAMNELSLKRRNKSFGIIIIHKVFDNCSLAVKEHIRKVLKKLEEQGVIIIYIHNPDDSVRAYNIRRAK